MDVVTIISKAIIETASNYSTPTGVANKVTKFLDLK